MGTKKFMLPTKSTSLSMLDSIHNLHSEHEMQSEKSDFIF